MVRELKRRGTAVALFLIDQRMPSMTGTQFLIEALKLYPDARKVLLTAYADTEAAITGINTVGLDHYLMKPWDPPEQLLYPVLDDLLTDWGATVRAPFEGIRVAGSRWSPRSYEIRDFLSRNQMPYRWIDLDADRATRELADEIRRVCFAQFLLFRQGQRLRRHGHRKGVRDGLERRADRAVVRVAPACRRHVPVRTRVGRRRGSATSFAAAAGGAEGQRNQHDDAKRPARTGSVHGRLSRCSVP